MRYLFHSLLLGSLLITTVLASGCGKGGDEQNCQAGFTYNSQYNQCVADQSQINAQQGLNGNCPAGQVPAHQAYNQPYNSQYPQYNPQNNPQYNNQYNNGYNANYNYTWGYNTYGYGNYGPYGYGNNIPNYNGNGINGNGIYCVPAPTNQGAYQQQECPPPGYYNYAGYCIH